MSLYPVISIVVVLFTSALHAQDHGRSNPNKAGSRYASDDPSVRSQLLGQYKVLSDLERPDNKSFPSHMNLYWDSQSNSPVLLVAQPNGEQSKLYLGTYEQTSGSSSHVARIETFNDSTLAWKSDFSQARGFDDYLQVIDRVTLTKTERGVEVTISKTTISTHYNREGKAEVTRTPHVERYALER